VAAATQGLTSRPVRPLFDGFAPQAPYRWVRPPPELAADNVPPEPAQRTIPLGEGGSEATNASTTDAQIILTLPAGAVPAHPPDTAVALTITPLDAGTLAPVSAPLRPASNAYQVSFVYQPSQSPVSTVSNATIAMTAASQGESLLHSADGTQWQTKSARPFGNTHGLVGPFTGPGYYVVATPPPTTTTAAGRGGSGSGAVVLVAAVVGAGAVGLVAVALRSRSDAKRSAARSRRGSSPGRGTGVKGPAQGARPAGRPGGSGRGSAAARRRRQRRRRRRK
jgi:hypothetical protein